VPCMIKGQYVIRFTITSQRTTVQDLTRDWNQIRSTATDVLEEAGVVTTNRKRVPLKEIKEKNESFGTSLLLANIGPNSPLTPKIVDGSFAALFNDDDVVVDFSKKLKTMQRDCSESSIIIIINVIITDIFIVIILLIILIISIPYLSVACSSSPRFHSSTLKTVQSHNFPTTKNA